MKFSYDIDVAELEEKVRKTNYDVNDVFKKFNDGNGIDRKTGGSFESEQRKSWRPKGVNDIYVEVRKSRYIPGKKVQKT